MIRPRTCSGLSFQRGVLFVKCRTLTERTILIVLQEEILRNAKVEVEKKFADEKFSLIADSVEKNGGARYTALFIRNQIKKMDQSASNAKNSAAAAAAAAGGGIRDTVTPDED